MSRTTVRIDSHSYAALQQLATSAGETVQTILEQAIKDYEAKCFWEGIYAACRAPRSDEEAWKEECDERHLWDAALMDDLDPDERWSAEGNVDA